MRYDKELSYNTRERLGYYQRTYRREWSASKNSARMDLIELCVERVTPEERRIKILSLPGPWWHFEKDISNTYAAVHHQRPSFICCEHDPYVFRMACCKIPLRKGRALKMRGNAELKCHVITNGSDVALFNCDIRDFVSVTDKRFDIAWLDLCCPLSEPVIRAVRECSRLMNHGSILAVTFMAARESPVSMREILRHGSRVDWLKTAFEDDYFSALRTWSYMDGKSAMCQVVFYRGDTE